jgi:cell division protein FtsW (lipid II flippase)
MIDRRLAQHIDVLLLVLVAAIVSMGVTTVYSATYAQAKSGARCCGPRAEWC